MLQLKKLASPKKEERDVDGRLMPQGSVLLTQCHWDNTCPLSSSTCSGLIDVKESRNQPNDTKGINLMFGGRPTIVPGLDY